MCHRTHFISVYVRTFQVLSPISDKSQEQNSDHQSNNSNSNSGGDSNSNNKTPKVSPTTNSNASTTTTTPTAANINNNNNNNLNINANNNNNNNNNEVKEALAVPWDVPKLRRRLEKKGGKGDNSLKQQHRRTTMAILADEDRLRGSDSGISIGSQVKSMKPSSAKVIILICIIFFRMLLRISRTYSMSHGTCQN